MIYEKNPLFLCDPQLSTYFCESTFSSVRSQ